MTDNPCFVGIGDIAAPAVAGYGVVAADVPVAVVVAADTVVVVAVDATGSFSTAGTFEVYGTYYSYSYSPFYHGRWMEQ